MESYTHLPFLNLPFDVRFVHTFNCMTDIFGMHWVVLPRWFGRILCSHCSKPTFYWLTSPSWQRVFHHAPCWQSVFRHVPGQFSVGRVCSTMFMDDSLVGDNVFYHIHGQFPVSLCFMVNSQISDSSVFRHVLPKGRTLYQRFSILCEGLKERGLVFLPPGMNS